MSIASSSSAPIRLTQFSQGGGCSCKIAPGVLSDILRGSGAAGMLLPKELLGGVGTGNGGPATGLTVTP